MNVTFRPVDADADAALLHGWVTHPKAVFWMMQDADVARVRVEYRAIAEHPHHSAHIGSVDGSPAFLVERYDPAKVELAGLYDAKPGDVGMHFLCAPADTPVRGFTRAVIRAIMTWLFEDPHVRRVVVEPDVRNTKVHALNATVGFEIAGVVRKPEAGGVIEKDALLSFCTRERFHGEAGHLTPDAWAVANRLLVRKALAEFAHERLITPDRDGELYVVRAGDVEYRFRAEILLLDHWHIDAASITRRRGEEELPLDAVEFCTELRDALGLSAEILPVYLEEISSTLSGSAYKLGKPALSAAELAAADFQTIETSMTEGHPGFVANNGRLGFGIDDHHAYAPETAAPVRLGWLAAHRDHATFHCSADTTYERFVEAELGAVTLGRFAATLRGLGLDLADYLLIPVHPWQWRNKLAVTFAGEVARRRLVFLGYGTDDYLAQQSVRTFFNVSDPSKHYVKTALSVLNMGFMRGLSAAYMEATPAINDWLAGLIAGDEVLRATCMTILRERAAVGYRNPAVRGGHRPVLPVPQDARRALAGEPGAVASTGPPAVHHGRAAAHRRGRTVGGRRAHHLLRAGPLRLAAPLSGRLPDPAAARLLRLRPGLHAARRERDPGALRRGRRTRHLQGHRRGDRGDGSGCRGARRRRAGAGEGARTPQAAVDIHRRVRLLLPLPGRDPAHAGRARPGGVLVDGGPVRTRLPGVGAPPGRQDLAF